MQENTKSDHFQTFSNRILDPNLVYSKKIRSIASISVLDSFSSRGTDYQECRKKLSQIILKPFPINSSSQNQFIIRKSGQSHQFQFQTLFHQEEPIIKNLFIYLFMSLGYDHQGSLIVVVHQVYMRIVKIQLSMYFIMIFKY